MLIRFHLILLSLSQTLCSKSNLGIEVNCKKMSISASRSMRFVTVGDGAVGKTCLIMSYAFAKSFPTDNYLPTACDILTNPIVDGKSINLQVWDTGHCPEEADRNRLRRFNYHLPDVFLLAFSLVSKSSYENVAEKWVPELRHYAPGVPIFLIGTKLDLRDDKEYLLENPGAVPISTSHGVELMKLVGASAYIECSAKTQQNVKAVFDVAVKVILQLRKNKNKKKKKKKRKSQKGCSIL